MVHIFFIIAILLSIPSLNKKFPFYLFSFFILFLFLALRYDYGNDYNQYHNIYISINNNSSIHGINDLLYQYLNIFIPSFYLLIAITSFFYIFSIYNLIKLNLKVNEYYLAILFLLINPYLFLIHLSSIRQTIAICIFIFAIEMLKRKKIIMYFIAVIIAAGFHFSAIILLPLYFFLNEKKIEMKRIIIVFIIVILLIFTSIFETLITYILPYLPLNYTYYFEQGLQNSLRATLLSSFFFFYIILNLSKLKGTEIIYGKLSLISTIISLLAIKLSMITRIGMYFDIFLIIGLTKIFSNNKTNIYIQISFYVMLLIYFLRYFAFFNNPIWIEHYKTYKTILGY